MSQNYRRLGLLARLKTPSGGIEKKLGDNKTSAGITKLPKKFNPFAIDAIEKAVVSEAKVERDADGNITRVISMSKPNPLGDPLNAFEDEDDEVKDVEDQDTEEWGGIIHEEGDTEVIRSLVEQAQNPAPKKPRHLSERETEWLERLVAKHGDDTRAMARDHRLNPMQQTASDIAKRLTKLQG